MMIVRDEHSAKRGRWSRFLQVNCERCEKFLFYYQKDGKGPLKRSYHDRIVGEKPKYNIKGYWHCTKCRSCLGFYEPYDRENNRPALRWANVATVYKIVPESLVLSR